MWSPKIPATRETILAEREAIILEKERTLLCMREKLEIVKADLDVKEMTYITRQQQLAKGKTEITVALSAEMEGLVLQLEKERGITAELRHDSRKIQTLKSELDAAKSSSDQYQQIAEHLHNELIREQELSLSIKQQYDGELLRLTSQIQTLSNENIKLSSRSKEDHESLNSVVINNKKMRSDCETLALEIRLSADEKIKTKSDFEHKLESLQTQLTNALIQPVTYDFSQQTEFIADVDLQRDVQILSNTATRLTNSVISQRSQFEQLASVISDLSFCKESTPNVSFDKELPSTTDASELG